MLQLFLLGRPRATRDGRPLDAVRGTKAWALLAYLLLADGPVERRRLGALLFPDAADPAATLRWNLSQLRRGLGLSLEGDPIELGVPGDTRIDIEILANSETTLAVEVAQACGQLLEGVSFDDHGALTLWLEGERRHLASLTVDVLREAAVLQLSRGDPTTAAELAERVVQLDPFDENGAVLLVRALREDGRPADAKAVADTTARRLRDELGVEPSSALWSAAHTSSGGAAGISGPSAVEAQLEAGQAALGVGIPDAGLDALREALGGARAVGDAGLLARCLAALGTGLVHAVRGSDQDGLSLLHEAVPIAAEAGLPAVSARTHRELGYVDMLRGRYERAQRWFTSAAEHAAGDDEELAWIAAFSGAGRTDVADYPTATLVLDEAVGRATAGGSPQAAAMAHAMRGRLRLLTHDDPGAAEDLERSLDIARGASWRSFQPWPATMQAEVAQRRGDLDAAAAILEPALATSRQVADPCWESMSLRGLGLNAVARGDVTGGLALLEDAPQQCRRLPDTYLWVEAYGLDALADVASQRGLPEAAHWIDQLEQLSTRHGMHALSGNVPSYRAR